MAAVKKVTKKKVVKKRAIRRKTVSVDTLLERAMARGSYSSTDKGAVRDCRKAQTVMRQAAKKIEGTEGRVTKAAEAISKGKTAKQKNLAKVRLAAAKIALREAIAGQREAAKVEKAAVALLTKLDRLHEKENANFVKAYNKAARAATKPKKRRVARKKVVKKA